MLLKIKIYILAHKFIATVVFLTALYGGYRGYQSLTDTSGETMYVLGVVGKQTIIAAIQGSGQVSTENQIDLKPRASGDIVYLGVAGGQEIKAGTLVAQLDARDAQKAVRDAEVSLESARLSLEKLEKPADALALLQAKNTLARAEETKVGAEGDLAKTYEEGFNTVSNAFLDLPNAMAGLADVLYGSNSGLDSTTQNIYYYGRVARLYDEVKAELYQKDADDKYRIARAAYDKSFGSYKSANRTSDTATTEALIKESYGATKDVAEAVKSATNLIQFYKDKLTERNFKYAVVADTHLASLNSHTGKTNTHLLNLLSITESLAGSKNTIVNATRSIAENTESLAKLEFGADALDLESSRLSVKQRENALLDAKEKLADYFVRAPFGGTIAKLSSKKGDTVSSASVLATLITKEKVAQISLNEVDVAKVKVGQKSTLTFDAVDGLSITGVVAEIDTVGTVAQGVVTYNAKISFDTNDDRVKSGMSASAAIITEIKQDVLAVPAAAVKSQGNLHSVSVVDSPPKAPGGQQGILLLNTPREVVVEIGLSNDTMTEIVSGLKEGEAVVTRTVLPTSAATTQAPSLFGGGGGNRPR